jgi:WD40 repeat protein
MEFKKTNEIRQHSMAIYAIAHWKENLIFSGGADCLVVLWDIDTGEQEPFTIKTSHPVYSLCIIDATYLSIGLNNGDLHIIHIALKKEIKFFKSHNTAIYKQLFIQQSNQLITGDAEGNISIWDTESWKLRLSIPLLCGKVRAITKSNDEKLIAIGGQDGVVRIFETNFFNETNQFYAHKEGVNSLAFIPINSNQIISGGKDGYLRLWNISTSEKLNAIPAHNYAIYNITLSPCGLFFSTASRDKSIKIWDINTLSVLQKLDAKQKGHSHSVNDLLWFDEQLISCGDDRRIITWKNIQQPEFG